jgi:hypothetical protein
MLALYAATGGVFFVIQAGLLARRSTGCRIRRLRAGLNRRVDVGWVSTSAEGRQLPHHSDGFGCPTRRPRAKRYVDNVMRLLSALQ